MTLEAFAAVAATVLIGAFAHPTVKLFTRCWILFYTLPLEAEKRALTRELIHGDFLDQDEALKEDGYTPHLRALHLFLRLMRSLPSDCAMAADGYYLKSGKRVFDIMFASLALVSALPIWAIAALAIGLTSSGPIFVRQLRCGRNGKTFTAYKFRTMIHDSERYSEGLRRLNEMNGPAFILRTEPRLTTVGRWLRKASIDELPQFINVLLGDMSIVGPRPPLPHELATYTEKEMLGLEVKPGLTCLWQVSVRSPTSFDELTELNIEYVRKRSLWLDLRIIIRTVVVVLRRPKP